MKKLSIVIVAVILGLLLAPVLGGSVLATDPPLDAVSAVLTAADRLAANQNADGGFDWELVSPPGSSKTNILGVTAMGILKAYEFEQKVTYRAALAKAYDYAVRTAPVYTWNGTKYVESPAGVDSFPDITFLVWLAQAADADANLLAAINDLQDPDIAAEDIAGLAKARWDDAVSYKGSTQQTPTNGTATTLAQIIRDARHGQGYDALIPWDLEAGVNAALALHGWFSAQGYDAQANAIGAVIHASVDDGTYFDSADQTQKEYLAGLTGAIEAYSELGIYTTEATSLKAKLLALQETDGSWDYYGATPATKSVQSTAYAVMALARQGDEDALMAARKAADWLRLSQNADGGWFSEDGAGDEYLEIDSEAAWALAAPAMLWVDAPDRTGKDGTAVVMVKLDPRAFEVFGFEFKLTYEPAVLNLDTVSPGSALTALAGEGQEGGYTWDVAIDETAGTIQVWVSLLDNGSPGSLPGLTSRAELVTASFTASAAGTCADVNEFTLSDEKVAQKVDGKQVPSATMGDSITAYKLVPVSGVVELQGRASGRWDGATVSLTGGPFDYTGIATDSDGAWSEDVACGTYRIYVDMMAYLDAEDSDALIDGAPYSTGSVKLLGGNADETPDGDTLYSGSENEIELADVVAIARVIGQAVDMTDAWFNHPFYPDINADGEINILDLVLAGINYTEEGPKTF